MKLGFWLEGERFLKVFVEIFLILELFFTVEVSFIL